MAVTVTEVTRRNSLGGYWEKIVDVLFDSSYPTGGEPLTPADCGFGTVLFVDAEVVQGAAVRSVSYDRTNSKLLAYAPSGAEVANLTDLSAVTARVTVAGR